MVTATFDKANIKVWFNTLGTSRNFKNVTEIVMSENSYLIKTSDENQYIMPMANVNMIEQINTDNDMDKKMYELKEKFKNNY